MHARSMRDKWHIPAACRSIWSTSNEDALERRAAELGTTTIKDTVNEALRRTIQRG